MDDSEASSRVAGVARAEEDKRVTATAREKVNIERELLRAVAASGQVKYQPSQVRLGLQLQI